ncbi:hypothetical protein Kpol_1064p51 [Vanderwaltozyma polyspora DSM 70294]|uniref:Large ribosomal subunit protein mL53 n=1 Tax=Vanderwaltozyma polyspora (strain ATCC 22028 / DSM 70294 / BCRC 21397 / CBS 2163 / NBRC 10782 / NRRL Y-8283 / UCD 57-17) TaxID=436907 RepID=A7TMH5_VANPO|nr:uncharacterized protein Kpol_1064p51 [Vanderwaltozyma polyspora DSM 70294]EDO16569.1 hypothetical protein Kpol_1064p51 [Vanderwaltozyma polyspora DSM 70294]
MITKYFSKIVVKFNPFGAEAKTARLFLCAIPPLQRMQGTMIQNELLTNGSTKKPILKVTFKDKTEMETNPGEMTFQEVSNYFDTHSRRLQLKETIEKQ